MELIQNLQSKIEMTHHIGKFNLIFLSVLSGLILSLAAPTLALPPTSMAQDSSSLSHAEQLLNALNATPEQKQKMQEIRNEYKDIVQQQQQQVRLLSGELSKLMAGNAPANQIREKHDQLMQLRQQMTEVQFKMAMEIREVLTPEQRDKLAELMEQRRRNLPRTKR